MAKQYFLSRRIEDVDGNGKPIIFNANVPIKLTAKQAKAYKKWISKSEDVPSATSKSDESPDENLDKDPDQSSDENSDDDQ